MLDAPAAGLTNRQIAERLYISPRTATVHVSHVLHKLGVPDRIQAARLAQTPGPITSTERRPVGLRRSDILITWL